MKNNSWWSKNGSLMQILGVLLLGQAVSFTMALMSFTSSLSANRGVDTPITLSFFTYLGLAVLYGSILLYRRQKLLVPWYWYLFIGFVDVQGNFCVNKAYQFSSITSVTILDCWTVAWVIVLTWIFLGTRYSLWQYFGAALCVTGLGLVLLSDAGVGGDGDGASNPILGDVLVIGGTLFYAISNVGEEFCVKKKDRVEVVAMMGLFGMLVSIVEIAIFERNDLASVTWSADVILTFAGYAVAGVMFYTLTPLVLQLSGSTLFNLSLLTADMWAVVFRIYFYQQQVDWLYFVSFSFVVIGLIVYSKMEKNPVPLPELEDGSSRQYLLRNEDDVESDRQEARAS